MTTTTTPALELAAKLTAIAEHLRTHPHLPIFHLAGDAYTWNQYDHPPVADMQIVGSPDGAHGVLLWAKTLKNVSIRIRKPSEDRPTVCGVRARGQLADGQFVDAWDLHNGDLYRRCGIEFETPITLEQLSEYVAAGTVEGIGAA